MSPIHQQMIGRGQNRRGWRVARRLLMLSAESHCRASNRGEQCRFGERRQVHRRLAHQYSMQLPKGAALGVSSARVFRRQVLHHEEVNSLVRPHVVDRADVSVLKGGDGSCFTIETGLCLCVSREFCCGEFSPRLCDRVGCRAPCRPPPCRRPRAATRLWYGPRRDPALSTQVSMSAADYTAVQSTSDGHIKSAGRGD